MIERIDRLAEIDQELLTELTPEQRAKLMTEKAQLLLSLNNHERTEYEKAKVK